METSLIEFFAKNIPPLEELLRGIGVFKAERLIIPLKLERMWMSEFGPVIFLIIVSFEIKHKIKVEGNFEMDSFFSLG